jgi:hypothetical protein
MAGAAFEGSLFVAALARRDSGQSHPVLAGGAHRPLNNGITHHPPPMRNDMR